MGIRSDCWTEKLQPLLLEAKPFYGRDHKKLNPQCVTLLPERDAALHREFGGRTGYCNHVLETTGKCCRTLSSGNGDDTCFGSRGSGSRSSLSESGSGGGDGDEISGCAHESFKKQRGKPPLG